MSAPPLKPLALPQRPTAAILAPASSAQQARLDAGAADLARRGWQMRWMPHAQNRSAPYFSGTAAERLADLHAALADPSVDAIVCTRGGYGSNYLLPELDLDLIRNHPKPLLGYSDLTAVQSRLLDQTGLVAFHGPMLAADFCRAGGVDEESLRAVLGGQMHRYAAAEGLRPLRGGAARGRLHGGCLTLLAASLGTPYAPALEGKLLFLEDVGIKPYQLDRMLRQLLLAGKLDGVPGIIFGEMQDCGSPGAPPGLLEQAILHALEDFRGPLAIGLRSGHVTGACVTLPLGVEAGLLVSEEAGEAAAELRMLEPAVRPRQAAPDMRS